VLKKSAMVSTAEKYAPEIEIFNLSRGFRARISRSGAQKTHFQRSECGRSGRTDFFNSIGQKRSVADAYEIRGDSVNIYSFALMEVNNGH